MVSSPRFKNWQTPPDFFASLNAEFRFTCDMAASTENALCSHYHTLNGCFIDGKHMGYKHGLEACWSDQRVFCNPPYDRTLGQWVEKAAKREADVAVLLLPPSVDTRWFHDFIWSPRRYVGIEGVQEGPRDGVEIRFHAGRLRFWREGKPGEAPRAGNLIAIFRK